jgi:hypothetical protein
MMATNKMETLLGLGSIQTERTVPGTQKIEGREFRYVSNGGQEEFGMFFKKLIRYVSPPIPKNGGAMIEGCKITLPDGEVFHAISYKGDIEGWRLQVEQGAKSLNVKLARIDADSIVLNDIQSFRLKDCKIDFE